MAKERGGAKAGLFGMGEEKAAALETLRLTRRYVLQETVGPFKALAKRAGIGLAGAFLLGIGLVVLLLAVLRVFQDETGTVFAGGWNFAPYLMTVAVAVAVVAVLAVLGLRAGQRRRR